MAKFKLLILYVLLFSSSAFSQGHFYDFFKSGKDFGSRNSLFYNNGKYMLLQGNHKDYGKELWVSDGTSSGTSILKDISTDVNASFSDFSSSGSFTAFNVYSKTPTELWCTDGTTSGTKKIVQSTYRYAGPTAFFNGWLFYLKVINDDTVQIRRTDTTSFTSDILVGSYPIPFDTRKSSFAVSDSFFYFSYDANLYRIDKNMGAPTLFWQTDPSQVQDIYSLNIYKNILVWCLSNASSTETRVYSSTEKPGTVKQVLTLGDRSNIFKLTGIGNIVFFTVGRFNSTIYFYKLETGTMAASLVTSSTAFYMQNSELEIYSNKVYFGARNASTFNTEIWSTNGTTAGTSLVKTISTDTMAIVSNLHAANGNLFFTAYTRKNGRELWTSKGTAATTSMLKDIVVGESSGIKSSNTWFDSYNPSSIVFNNRLFINAYSDSCGVEPWISDGSSSGTLMLKDVNDDFRFGDQEVGNFMVAGDYLFLTAADSLNGAELWRTDGTRNGTQLAENISPAFLPTGFDEFTEFKNKLFVTAISFIDGQELYTSNGKPGAGNSFFVTPSGIFNSSSPHDYAVKEPYLYYIGMDSLINTDNVFRSDGTRAGTQTLNKGLSNSYTDVSGLRKVGDRLYFSAKAPGKGIEPMVSDGKLGGAIVLKDIYSGTASSNPQFFCGNTTATYFSATDGSGKTGVYKTDGTEIGTSKLFDFNQKELNNAKPDTMFYHNGLLYLRHFYTGSKYPKTTVIAVWDLSADSMRILQPLSGETYSDPKKLQVLGNKIIFTANTSKTATEPWITDGTRAGTFMLSDIMVGNQSSAPSPFTVYNGLAFFSAKNTSNGREAWVSDGTTAGTRLLWDIEPGNLSSNPSAFIGYKGSIYIAASQGKRINSLFRIQADNCNTGAIRLRNTGILNTLCENSQTTLFVEYGGSQGALNWYRNDSLLTYTNDTLKTGIQGKYHVVSTVNTCANPSNTLELKLQTGLKVNIRFEKDSFLCEGGNITLKQDNADLETRWFINNIQVTTGNTLKTTVAGTIYATGIDGFGCAKISNVLKPVKVLKPVPSVIFRNDSLLCSISADSFQWFFNNNVILNAKSFFYKPFIYGNYHVEAFNKEGCRGVSSAYKYSDVSIRRNTGKILGIYPNPVKNVLNFTHNTGGRILIYDALGKVCINAIFDQNTLDVSGLISGIYTLVIKSGENEVRGRFVKE